MTRELPPDLVAGHIVLLNEIKWFETLDERTVQRIAATAPEGSDERDIAQGELERRAENRRPPAPDVPFEPPPLPGRS